ncbi:glutathione peroxidase [Thiohalophilus sp.]|uniref:glutathione peroxidase n=1 Tax=Thiohalophilus sp. TaxID=3028392 RepID=UPI00397539BB
MKAWLSLLLLPGLVLSLPVIASECPASLDFSLRTLNEQQTVNLCERYRHKVVLIVNTASKCAFTPQYEGLEALYARYRSQGLVVLGFPSNDFAHQEPGSEAEIRRFCRLTYGVEFPMFAKTRVREPHADPLYAWLGRTAGEFPQWNFHKYLLDRQGRLVGSYPAQVRPDAPALTQRIEALLQK